MRRRLDAVRHVASCRRCRKTRVKQIRLVFPPQRFDFCYSLTPLRFLSPSDKNVSLPRDLKTQWSGQGQCWFSSVQSSLVCLIIHAHVQSEPRGVRWKKRGLRLRSLHLSALSDAVKATQRTNFGIESFTPKKAKQETTVKKTRLFKEQMDPGCQALIGTESQLRPMIRMGEKMKVSKQIHSNATGSEGVGLISASV